MNEEQYRSICEACDRVLLEPSSTLERVAIPWLHVVREHPVLLANYGDLFEPSTRIRTFVRHCGRLLRNHFVWLRQIFSALSSSGVPWFEAKALPRNVDVLFVSHLLTEAQANQTDDFYFGDLPNKLAEQGLVVVVALINHTRLSGARLVGGFDNGIVPRIIFSDSLGILDELALYRRLKVESQQLRRLARMEPAGLQRKIFLRASHEALASSNLRLSQQIRVLVDKLNTKAVIVTHEGHAWERVVFAAARSSLPNVCCIGYQHAALFRLQHAVRRKLSSRYNPDQILTAGAIAKTQLENEPNLATIGVSVLGSNRALQIDACKPCYRPESSSVGYSDAPACLVVPEGIESECHILFEFSLACASNCPTMQFIWRLHPLMTYESLAVANPKLLDLPENIVLSTLPLTDDIERCQWVLHRGSTVVIQAVAAGLQPIYLTLHDEMTISPLYEVEHYGVKVETAEQFRYAINMQKDLVRTSENKDADGLITYCKKFYMPFDYTLIPRLISRHTSVI